MSIARSIVLRFLFVGLRRFMEYVSHCRAHV
jgi:hypothetical protein